MHILLEIHPYSEKCIQPGSSLAELEENIVKPDLVTLRNKD
jgi:hypothetical protein